MSVTDAPRRLVNLVRDVLDRYGRLGGSQLTAAIRTGRSSPSFRSRRS
jgi:hypothetical protein